MSNIKRVAEQYFSAFHNGNLEEVFSYLSDDTVVKYGTEPTKRATVFFPETKEMISQIQFKTLGVYTSDAVNNVIIHFSFEIPNEKNELVKVEAIDIIEFNQNEKISKITVIPNG